MDVTAYKTNVLGRQGQQTTTGTDAFSEVDMSKFINLMVAELSNQDPMDPMKNDEILQQMSQMREIASNDKLTDTLESLQLGQSMATGSSLLGQVVLGLDDTGGRAVGAVDRVSISRDEGIRVHVGGQSINLKNVVEVYPSDTDPAAVAWPASAGRVSGGGEEDTREGLYW